MQFDQLQAIFDKFRAVPFMGEMRANCPLCQPNNEDSHKFKIRITPGESRPALVGCVKCGRDAFNPILSHYGIEAGELGEAMDTEAIKGLWNDVEGLEEEVEQKYPLAPIHVRNRIYSQLLTLCPPLPQKESEWLNSKGLANDLVKAFQYGYYPPQRKAKLELASTLYKTYGDELFEVPGFVNNNGIPDLMGGELGGVLIPCRDKDGNIRALKVREVGKVKGKYRLLSSRAFGGPKGEMVAHYPLNTNLKWHSDNCPWIVEGERNADYCQWFQKTPLIAIPGVRALSLLDIGGLTKLVLAFDKDLAGYKATLEAANLYAGKVELAYAHWEEEQGKGLDDCLANGHTPVIEEGLEWLDKVAAKVGLSYPKVDKVSPPPAELGAKPPPVFDRLTTGYELYKAQFPPLKWAIEGLLPEGLSIFAGKAKTRKSYFMLDVTLGVASGNPVLGGRKVTQGDVLYLSLEDTPSRTQRRMVPIAATRGLTPEMLHRIHLPNRTGNWFKWGQGCLEGLKQWLDTLPNARLIVIDTLAKIRPVNKGSDRDKVYAADEAIAEALKILADERHISIVLVHHVVKGNPDNFWDSILGSSAFQGVFDGLLGFIGEEGASEAILRVKGRDVEETKYRMEWIDEGQVWELGEEIAGDYNKPNKRETKLSKAKEWLAGVLSHGEPISSHSIQLEAEKHSYSIGDWETVKKAANAIGVVKVSSGRAGSTWQLTKGVKHNG